MIIFVSADYLAEDSGGTELLPGLLKDAQDEGIAILPVLVNPCPWRETELVSYPFANPQRPLSTLREPEQDEVFVGVTAWLRDLFGATLQDTDEAAETTEDEETFDAGARMVYLIIHERDTKTAVRPLHVFLRRQGFDVQLPVFSGDPADVRRAHEHNLHECDAVLIYYGNADPEWMEAMVEEVSQAPGVIGRKNSMTPVSAVYVAGPADDQKTRFHSAAVDVVIRDEGAFSPEALAPFLQKIKALYEGPFLYQQAEEAYAELEDERQRRICEQVFKALTDAGSDPVGRRRPTRLGTLCAVAEAGVEEVAAVIDAFRKPDRLLLTPPPSETLNEETVIDVADERLMQEWTRLRDWMDQEAASAHLYRRLVERAMLYAEGKDDLLQGLALQEALDWRDTERPSAAWAARYGGDFDRAMAFLDQSEAAREEREREERVSYRLYISSTVQDLQEHRSALAETALKLGHQPTAMEAFSASDVRPLDQGLADVRASDVFIGIFAWRYGYVPEGSEKGVTELEYEEARKFNIPCLIFLLAEDAPWPRSLMDEDLGRVERFRERLKQEQVVSFFSTLEELVNRFAEAVGALPRLKDGTTRPAGPAPGVYRKEVYLSYSWRGGGESEEIADRLEQAFRERGIAVVRDLGAERGIEDFTERPGRDRAVVVILGDAYLRSPRCMGEWMRIAQGVPYNRVFPVVLDNAHIDDPKAGLDYRAYWEEQGRQAMGKAAKNVPDETMQAVSGSPDPYEDFQTAVERLPGLLRAMNTFAAARHRPGFEAVVDAVVRTLDDTVHPA